MNPKKPEPPKRRVVFESMLEPQQEQQHTRRYGIASPFKKDFRRGSFSETSPLAAVKIVEDFLHLGKKMVGAVKGKLKLYIIEE